MGCDIEQLSERAAGTVQRHIEERGGMWNALNALYPVERYAKEPGLYLMAQTTTLVRTENDADLKTVFGLNLERSVDRVAGLTDTLYLQPQPLNECGAQQASSLVS